MNDKLKPDTDAGTIAALMQRMLEQRLPRAERILVRMRAGERLSDVDLDFLKRVEQDSRWPLPLIRRHPEYLEILTRGISLYEEILTLALENEKATRD